MKIFQIITELRPAGAERVVADLCVRLKKESHEAIVISLAPLPEQSVIVDELRAADIKVLSLNLSPGAFLKAFRLGILIDEFQPDIVHSHLFHANFIARLCCRGRKSKLVNTVHIAERRKGKWWHFLLDRITFRFCAVQTSVSKAVRRFHTAKIGVPQESSPLIYNGVVAPESLDSKAIADLKSGWDMTRCSKIIGSVGRLDWQKGYDALLDMLPEISAIVPVG